MDLVIQTTGHGCGAACLAMLLGLSSQAEAEERLGRSTEDRHDWLEEEYPQWPPYLGVTYLEVQALLWEEGKPTLVCLCPTVWKGSWLERGHKHIRFPDLLMAQRHILGGGTAMAGVNSKNVEGGGHWVVVHGGRVLDPSPNKTYTDLKDVVNNFQQEVILVGGPPWQTMVS